MSGAFCLVFCCVASDFPFLQRDLVHGEREGGEGVTKVPVSFLAPKGFPFRILKPRKARKASIRLLRIGEPASQVTVT